MSNYFEIDWESPWSPLYGSHIAIPEHTILWRSYDKSYPAIGNRFAYYSSRDIAQEYKKNNTRKLGHFISTRPLRLLDYRFMKVLLSRLINMNSHEKSIQELASVILSFGLCSLGHQIELVKMRYNNLNKATKEYTYIQQSITVLENYYKPGNVIEQIGVRIAETTNDTYTMGFLQELFKGLFDGFISPRMYSPFHIEKPDSLMSPEIIIFNPSSSGIEELKIYPTNAAKIKIYNINELLRSNHGYILIDNVKKRKEDLDIRLDFFMYGGSSNDSHHFDIADNLLNENDSELLKQYNNGRKVGIKWNKKIELRRIYTPAPCFPISPFPLEMGV